MKKYIFSQEYADDIENSEYISFVSSCCKYSKYLSYDYYWWDALKKPETPPIEKILKYEVHNFEKILTVETRKNWEKSWLIHNSQILIDQGMKRKYFEINEDTKNFVLSYGSLFSYWEDAVWLNYNYEPAQNLIFYRDDQTAFFRSVTHERYCSLYPNDDEDVSIIINKPGWISSDSI